MTSSTRQALSTSANVDPGYVSSPKGKVTGGPGAHYDVHSAAFDLDNALQLMAPEIGEWVEITTQRLQGALATHISLGGKPPRSLLHLLQDFRGQAGSIGFPLASRVAAALYRLLEAGTLAPADVLVSHIDAIRAIVVEDARGTENLLASSLVQALEEFGEIWIAGESGKNSESSSST
jgi:hypothetical protein